MQQGDPLANVTVARFEDALLNEHHMFVKLAILDTGKNAYIPYNPRHVPVKRMRDFEYWRNLGEVSALNGFDIEVVQSLNRYR